MPDPGKQVPADPAPPTLRHRRHHNRCDGTACALNEDLAVNPWGNRLPPYLKTDKFDLHGPGWWPEVITELGDRLHDFPDVFSIS